MLSSARSLIIVGVLALAIIAAIVVADLPRAETSAQGTSDDPATTSTSQQETELRATATQLSEPVHVVRSETLQLRDIAATAIAGTADRDAVEDQVTTQADRLRTAADELSDASDTSAAPQLTQQPAEPGHLLAQRVRYDVAALAGQVRATADQLERAAIGALTLRAHADELAALADELPETDEPSTVLAAWEAELERLEQHRTDARAAGEHPALTGLATLHLDITDRLSEVAQAAVDHLDGTVSDEDVAAYDGAREEHLDALAELGVELVDATESAIAAIAVDAEAVHDRALTLASRLDEVRRDAADTTPQAPGADA